MAYSTVTELKNNVKMIENTFDTAPTPDEFAAERIAMADKVIKAECGRWIDFSLVPDDETTPVVNLLSIYKSAELALRRIAGIKRRQNENDDISEWMKNYNDLKMQLMNGEIDVLLADGSTVVTTTSGEYQDVSRPDIRPFFGYDEYGEWVNEDDLEELRGDVDTDYYS